MNKYTVVLHSRALNTTCTVIVNAQSINHARKRETLIECIIHDDAEMRERLFDDLKLCAVYVAEYQALDASKTCSIYDNVFLLSCIQADCLCAGTPI